MFSEQDFRELGKIIAKNHLKRYPKVSEYGQLLCISQSFKICENESKPEHIADTFIECSVGCYRYGNYWCKFSMNNIIRSLANGKYCDFYYNLILEREERERTFGRKKKKRVWKDGEKRDRF